MSFFNCQDACHFHDTFTWPFPLFGFHEGQVEIKHVAFWWSPQWYDDMFWLDQISSNWPMEPLLVGGIPTPLKNMSSSVGMMKFPIDGKIKCSKSPTRLDWTLRLTLTLVIRFDWISNQRSYIYQSPSVIITNYLLYQLRNYRNCIFSGCPPDGFFLLTNATSWESKRATSSLIMLGNLKRLLHFFRSKHWTYFMTPPDSHHPIVIQ